MLRPEHKGSVTEIACLEFLERAQIKYEDIRAQYPVSVKYPFSSSRKRMSSIIELPNGKRRIVIKGASEIVFSSCNSLYIKSTNSVINLN